VRACAHKHLGRPAVLLLLLLLLGGGEDVGRAKAWNKQQQRTPSCLGSLARSLNEERTCVRAPKRVRRRREGRRKPAERLRATATRSEEGKKGKKGGIKAVPTPGKEEDEEEETI